MIVRMFPRRVGHWVAARVFRWLDSRLPPEVRALREASERDRADAIRRAADMLPTPSQEEWEAVVDGAVREASSDQEALDAIRRAAATMPPTLSQEEWEAALIRAGARPPNPNALDQLQKRLRKRGIKVRGLFWRSDGDGGYYQVVVDEAADETVAAVLRAAEVSERLVVTAIADIA